MAIDNKAKKSEDFEMIILLHTFILNTVQFYHNIAQSDTVHT